MKDGLRANLAVCSNPRDLRRAVSLVLFLGYPLRKPLPRQRNMLKHDLSAVSVCLGNQIAALLSASVTKLCCETAAVTRSRQRDIPLMSKDTTGANWMRSVRRKKKPGAMAGLPLTVLGSA